MPLHKIIFNLCISIVGIFLFSCISAKRDYKLGYHTQWLEKQYKDYIVAKDNIFDFQSDTDGVNHSQIVSNKLYTEILQSKWEKQKVKKKESNLENQITASLSNYDSDSYIKQINKTNNKKIYELIITKKDTKTNSEFYDKKTSIPNLPPDYTQDNTKSTSGFAIAGFICGIVGLLVFLALGWPFLLGTLSIIFSSIGLAHTAKRKRKGKGYAIAGLILGALTVILFWAFVILIISFLL